MKRKQDLLFCEQKRSKKNFDSRWDLVPAVPQRTHKVFFASFLFTKKKTLLLSNNSWMPACAGMTGLAA
jgi:hypothetical protein